ncbi:hypothetical protein ACSBR2_009993 [Camellia fascicularis]
MSKAASLTGPIAGDRKPPETRRQAPPVPSRASENPRTHHESETRPSKRSGDIFISHGQSSPPKARSRLLQPVHPQPNALHAHEQYKYSVAWLPVSNRWRSLRKILNSNIFSGNRLDATQELRRRKVAELVDYAQKCSECGEYWESWF